MDVPCTPEMQAACTVFQQEGECYEDTHHDFWPRTSYRTSVEKQFRQLPVNQRLICRALHNEIHAEGIPIKPTRDLMLQVIDHERQRRD